MSAISIPDERVNRAWQQIDRSQFVPPSRADEAEYDAPVPIGWGQTISQPSLVAYMTACAAPQATDLALEIGTGSGYQAALLAALVRRVYTIETIPELASAARRRLRKLGYTNIEFRTGDGNAGWPEKAPFDIIMVTAAAESIPQALLEQLAEGGRMIIPLGAQSGPQDLYKITRHGEAFKRAHLLPVRFVPFVRP